MAAAAILKVTEKSRYLRNSLTDLHKILNGELVIQSGSFYSHDH